LKPENRHYQQCIQQIFCHHLDAKLYLQAIYALGKSNLFYHEMKQKVCKYNNVKFSNGAKIE